MTEPYSQLEAALTRAIRQIKADLNAVQDGYLNFSILAHGRIEGDTNITFRLGYSSDEVHCEGGRLHAVVGEYERRMNWRRRNAPTCLPNVDTSQDRRIDEIIDELEDEKHNG